MTLLLALLGLAISPALSLHHTGPQEVNRVRDLWLLGVLALALVYSLEHALVFAPLAAWFLWRWRTVDVLPSVTTWVAIGATWQLAKSVPVDLVRWLPIAWLVIACALSVLLVVQRFWGEDLRTQKESFGWLGQRTFAGAYLALVLPFAPVWLWPLLGVGFFLTGPSWLASIALVGAGLVMQPRLTILVLAALAAILGGLHGVSRLRRRYAMHLLRTSSDVEGSHHPADIEKSTRRLDRDSCPGVSGVQSAPRGDRALHGQGTTQIREREDPEAIRAVSPHADVDQRGTREQGLHAEDAHQEVPSNQGDYGAPTGLVAYLLEQFTPRGTTFDGLEQRGNKYRLMLRHLTWQGHGPHTLTRQLLRWNSQYSTPEQREPLPLGNAHNDYLELVWDYGLAGGLLILLAAVDIGSRMRWGDPWSAAAVVAAVLALGSYPCRVAPVGLVMLTIWAEVGR